MDIITKKIRNIWSGMVQRCYNPKTRGYRWYGAKGITVCDEWRHFRAFKAWAVASGFKPGLSIERIDNSKGYCPENCKLIPLNEQGKNRSDNHYITMNGETKTLSDWSKSIGINRSALCHRLARGMNEETAISNRKYTSQRSKYPDLDNMIHLKFGTKKQMAKSMGWDIGLLSRITLGYKNPTIDEAYAISVALDSPFMTIVSIFLAQN